MEASVGKVNDEEVLKELSTHMEYLAVKSVLTDQERDLVLGTTHALKDHLVRESRDASTATLRGRLS